MKQSLAISLLLLSCLSSTLAMPDAASPPPSALVPDHELSADSWEYAAFRQVQMANIVIYNPDRPLGGSRGMTRHEFAGAVSRLLPFLSPMGKPASSEHFVLMCQDLPTRLKHNPAAIDALTRLTSEFQPELAALGQDVPAAQGTLADIKADALKRADEDIPAESRIYNDLFASQGNSITLGFFGRASRRALTRREVAAIVSQILPLLQAPGVPRDKSLRLYPQPSQSWVTPTIPPTQHGLDAARVSVQHGLKRSPDSFPALERLVQELTPELELLGEDVPTANARLAELDQDRPGGRPFPDVPEGHWAFQAVEVLRRAGVVVGLPDGRYQGE